MKIGFVTDGLSGLPLEEALDWVVEQGIEAVEVATGGFSQETHCDKTRLLEDRAYREQFQETIQRRGLFLSALNCNGNPLDPDPARSDHKDDLFQTIEIAALMGLDTIVTMSGCPGTPDGSKYPNWVVHPHPPVFAELLQWQWEQVVTPFWKDVGRLATERGVRIAIEMHPGMVVYNPTTLMRLREIAGPAIGANFDPSHMFYQGIDSPEVVRTLGRDVIFHVHAKDTVINPYKRAFSGVLDTRPMTAVADRSWAYRTLGFGHDARWWSEFISALRMVGYDGALSIEHEDMVMSAKEGIRKSVDFLQSVIVRTPPDEKVPWAT